MLTKYPWRLLAVVVSLYLLTACAPTGRVEAPKTQTEAVKVQAIADAQAGLDAFASAPGVTFDEAAGKMLEGAREYNLAAAGKTHLPAPTMAPSAILADPDSYHKAAVTTRQKADGTWLKVLATAGISTALAVAAAASRFIPGVGPVVQPIASALANVHWFALASKDEKDAERRRDEAAGHFKAAADVIRKAMPEKMDAFPPAVQAAIKALAGEPQV